MIWIVYDIIFLWYHMPMISWFYIYDIIPLQCMISVTYDIIGLWYHNQYHMQNHIWYHGIKTMISYFWIYDISNLWYHRSMISYMITSMFSPMFSPMISQSIPTLTQFCRQMISMWLYPIAQASWAWQRQGVELDSDEERKAEVWKFWMACALCPALLWQRLQGQGWWWRLIAVTPLRRDDRSTTLVVWRHRRSIFRRCRSPSTTGGGAGGCTGCGGGGSGGSARATPAPEPSLGLASQVKLDLLVASLLQTFEGCCVLVIANAGNPAVVGPEVRSDGKKDSYVGDELPREGPGWWHLRGGCSWRNEGEWGAWSPSIEPKSFHCQTWSLSCT